MSIKPPMKRHPLLAFVGIAFLISWGAWLSSASKQAFLIGAFAPGIAAMIVVGLTEGIAGLQRLFERLLIWRVHFICYAAALLLPAAVSLMGTAIHMMFGGEAPDFSSPPAMNVKLPSYLQGWGPAALIIPLFIQHILYGTAIAEELGWRGLALSDLQKRHNSLVASLALAGLWALWILPFYWKQGWIGANERILMLLAVVPGAILSTWGYNISGGSLLLCMIFNIALKVTDLVLAASPSRPLVGVCAYAMAAGLVLSFAGVNLGAAPKQAAAVESGEPPGQSETLIGGSRL